MKPPRTKWQVRALLGVLGFCQPWIPSFGELARSFVQLTMSEMADSVEWTKPLNQAFKKIKQPLSSAPALSLPNYSKPFILFIHENQVMGLGVLAQELGPILRPVAYYSVQLDLVARGTVPCLQVVAATMEIVKRSKDTILTHPLTLSVPHNLFTMLLKSQTQTFTQQLLTQYEAELFTTDHITFE